MNQNVQELLVKAKNDYDSGVRMSSGDLEKQTNSFAFGNANIENPRITRELIAQEADKLKVNEGTKNTKPR